MINIECKTSYKSFKEAILTFCAWPLTNLILVLSSQLTYHNVPDDVPIMPFKKWHNMNSINSVNVVMIV